MRKLFVLCLLSVLSACDIPSQQVSKVVLPEPGSEGAKMMQKYCASCHAPPSTTVHTAEEWPNVIYRMQERRRMEAYELMSDEEVAVLVGYLQRNAKG